MSIIESNVTSENSNLETEQKSFDANQSETQVRKKSILEKFFFSDF